MSELVRGFYFKDYVGTLLKDPSTGNQKKAFLITTFAQKRPLLLLDEPVNGLDFQSTEYRSPGTRSTERSCSPPTSWRALP